MRNLLHSKLNLAGGLAGLMLASSVFAASTIDPAHPYAWGANIGWIDAQGDVTNGAVVGQSYCSGQAWSANCGWINLGNGPTNGWHYSNGSATDWGVNHDGQGRLTGYAWAPNVGWVNFEQAQGLPRIDLLTGNLSGYVWGENVGWISLDNAQAYVRTATLSPGPDTDSDGIPDAWEMQRAGDLTTLGGSYADGDDTPDVEEYKADTDPLSSEHLEITSVTRGGGFDTVYWTSRPTRLYRVEATNGAPVTPGPWADVGGGLIGPPGTSPSIAVVQPGSDTTKYYRVRAVMPLGE